MSSRNFLIAVFHAAILIILLASCSQAVEITPTIKGTTGRPATTTGLARLDTPAPTGPVGPAPAIAFDLTSGAAGLQGTSALIWLSGNRIAVAGTAGVALIGLPTQGAEPQALQQSALASGDNPTFLTASPTKTGITWVSAGNTVQYWDTSLADQAKVLISADNLVTGLAINPPGNIVAYATTHGELVQLDVTNNTVIQNWQIPGWLTNLSYSPDNNFLAGVDLANFTATIFSQDGQVERQLAWAGSASSTLYGGYLSPDWTIIAWVAQSAVQLMNASSGQEGPLLNHEDAVSSIAWSPDSKIIATAAAMTSDGELNPVVYVWSPDLDQPITTIVQNAPVQSLSFSPDGLSLAVLDVSGSVQIFNLSR
jgi:WD40 repeat protein